MKKIVIVEQFDNPKYNENYPTSIGANSRYVYRVVKTINVLRVHISQWLTPAEVQNLMDNEIEVSVTLPK